MELKFSNIYGIKSKSVINALTWDDYDMSDRPDNVFSCTEIIDAPKAKVLNYRHRFDVTRDVSDNFWILDGNAIHYTLEMSNKKGKEERLSEERIFIRLTRNSETNFDTYTLNKNQKITDAEWYNKDDIFIAVKFDNYDLTEGVIEDYKRTQVWEVVYGLKPERMNQLNIGALALSSLGFEIKLLRAVLLLKSWDRNKALQGGNYPQIPYAEFEEKPRDWIDVLHYIRNRVELHKSARNSKDDDIPCCTSEERWYSGTKFAVMKKGNKKATKVFDTKKEAEDFISVDTKNLYYVENRPGINKRCEGYCPANMYCNFYKSLVTKEYINGEQL